MPAATPKVSFAAGRRLSAGDMNGWIVWATYLNFWTVSV